MKKDAPTFTATNTNKQGVVTWRCEHHHSTQADAHACAQEHLTNKTDQPQWPAPLPKPPKRHHRFRNFVVLPIGALVILFVVIGIVGNANNKNTAGTKSTTATTTTPAATTTAPAATTTTPAATTTTLPLAQARAAYKASAQPVTVSQLVNDPSYYNGDVVEVGGTIVSFVHDSSGDPVGMNLSGTDAVADLYVQLSSTADVTQMNTGDTVTIWGDGAGTTSGTNAFGATLNFATIDEVYLTDATSGYTDNSSPNPQ